MQYNLLKLPSQVSFTSGKIVRYQYDAEGTKLKMSAVNGESRDYVGAFQYLTPAGGSRSLFEISTEEGRYTPASGYEYYHRDHLGNVRAVQGQSGVSQWADYDPWGLELSGLSNGSSTSRVRFNGQEAIAEIGAGYLDFGRRGYDAAIGRWGVVDPLAEVSRRWSPFVFGYNNPVQFVDPDGMNGVDTQKQESQGFQYSDGYSTQDSRFTTGAVQFEGAYQSNGGGGEQQGGTEQGGPGPKAQTSSGVTATNQPGTGVRKNSQGQLESFDSKQGTITNELFSDPILVLFDTFNGTNLSGINSNPNQSYVGGGVPLFGVPAPGIGVTTVEQLASRATPTLTEQAAILSKQIGKNSITLGTATKQIRFDLLGKSHGNVPTPHMQIYNKNFVDGVQKSISRASKEAIPMAQREVRAIRKYLEKIGN